MIITRDVRSSVNSISSQIYHQTDRDRFSHNWNWCTSPRVGFPTYRGVVFSDWFNRFIIFQLNREAEPKKKKKK